MKRVKVNALATRRTRWGCRVIVQDQNGCLWQCLFNRAVVPQDVVAKSWQTVPEAWTRVTEAALS